MANSINRHLRLKIPPTPNKFLALLIVFAKPNQSQKYIKPTTTDFTTITLPH